ncbi:low-specificity L-threonine aldolase [Marinigracilibium pacificum]|uniref:Low-specificity L-threonine aldolase n=1 Tax=Marinigracilibium pacificum TaxID=2729599 RepID=A0A848J2A9_9BACT|nr:low-specificity L-threonine aldolase [Marinigracilibium pacificum]NMM48680.1 low-specificity L-threonine aldolase [Marinigracilibium pacificum]
MIVDLRSDTVTKPSAEMREVMLSAPVGDDVFNEDPTVNELEEYAANLLGKEAALFCPSGTMTNQIAIRCLTQPQDEVICDQRSHIYNYEGGGLASNSLVSVRLADGERGILTPELIEPCIHHDDIHYPVSRVIGLENTVNKGGGACYKVKDIAPIADLAKERNLKLHLDGARFFNAIVSTNEEITDHAKYFDTISICLSKGLGAPVGSLLVSDKNTIKKATRVRKVMGGGMRQAGIIAAAGLYALKNNIDRLSEDHSRAKQFGSELNSVSYISEILPVETNIVIFKVTPSFTTENVLKAMEQKGILAVPFGPGAIRLVTHLDFTDDQLEYSIKVFKQLF